MLTKAEINLNNLEHNINYLKSLSGTSDIYPVIKANAYGHGVKHIALKLDQLNVKCVCIATINELIDLKNMNLKYSILHLGRIAFDYLSDYEDERIIATIHSIEDLQLINRYFNKEKKIRVHIKVDTGMTRMGCNLSEFQDILYECMNLPFITLEGIYSHLSNSENKYSDHNDFQFSNYNQILSIINKNQNNNNIKFHLLNSGGLFNFKNYRLDAMRIGLALYGILPNNLYDENLKPIMKLTSPIVLNKNISKGTKIGYGCNYEAKNDMKISIVQCGYADGLPYYFSNKALFDLNNKLVPILGTVSMDLVCIDTTDINCSINDRVIIWGGESKKNRIENIAEKFKVIPYTLITGLSNRIKREYID